MTSLIVGVFVLTSMYMCVLSRTGVGLYYFEQKCEYHMLI